MEGNVCGVNHMDSDALLPPRKRLLACLKKQNSDINGDSNTNSPSIHNSLDQLDARISFLLKAQLSNGNPSMEEIVTAAQAAAEVAVKVATGARAAAQEKAVVAAKAMAAAKKALQLVANVEDGHDISYSGEQQSKTDDTKKQADVKTVNDSKKPRLENGKKDDEELARKLHQAINSSPRISKCVAPSGVKIHKHKKLKTLENGSKLENGPKQENEPNAKCGGDDVTVGRKRGRMKQKKLPLSICHYRDEETPNDVTYRGPLSDGPSERGALWKCQAFKRPICVKQKKVMQL